MQMRSFSSWKRWRYDDFPAVLRPACVSQSQSLTLRLPSQLHRANTATDPSFRFSHLQRCVRHERCGTDFAEKRRWRCCPVSMSLAKLLHPNIRPTRLHAYIKNGHWP